MAISRLLQLPLAVRVGMLATIFVLPLALVAYFHVSQNLDSVTFTKVERVGLNYLRTVQPVLLSTTATSPRDVASFVQPPSVSGADALTLNVGDQARRLDTLLAAAPNAATSEVSGKVVELLSAMNDSSNLSLDPDMDSYYLQDALINQIDAMLSNAQLIHEIATKDGTGPSSGDARIAIAAARANFASAAASFSSDMKKALSSDVTGEASPQLGQLTTTLSAAASRLLAASGAGDVSGMHAAMSDLHAASSVFMSRADGVLDDMLAKRISGVYWTLAIQMLIAIVLVLIGTIASYAISQSIVRPIGAICAAMKAMTSGDLSVDVPGHERRDEIGAMATAVLVFKEKALENQQLQKEADRNRAEAERNRIAQEEQKEKQRREDDARRLEVEAEKERHRQVEQAKSDEIARMMTSIATGFKELSAGNLEIRLTDPFNREFEQLREDFNRTVARLQEKIIAERKTAEETAKVVDKIAGNLKALSIGDLQVRLNEAFPAEYEQLRADFNSAVARLHETLLAVITATSGINTGADEISQASDDLSRRTEQQAASLEETSAALEEITATVKRTAENAKDAARIVSIAKEAAESGGGIVKNAVKAMEQIEQSSKQITDIIGVIDEIAFQTNLLALNAGVEAARAGDSGRGFAVVASEVRTLAQRSSEASREIRTLIRGSSEHVASGVKLVGESGLALNRIVEEVQKVSLLVTEMSQASQHQATGIDEVNSAVAQMDQVTQQNAAMVEQSTAAARSLSGETAELARMTAFFKIGDQGGSPSNWRAKRKTVPQLKHASSGGRRSSAAAALSEDSQSDDWQEF